MKFYSLFLLFILPFLYCCETDNETNSQNPPPISDAIQLFESKSSHSISDSTTVNDYNLDEPSKILPLPSKLMEISGLSYFSPKNQLLGIHDEKGIIYFINAQSGVIEEKTKFGKRGDYEGVELVGNKIYVIKSNGTISVFDLKKKKAEDKIKTPFSTTNDIEGLGYLENENALLIACKGKASIDKDEKLKKTKAIYKFDLSKKETIETPWLTIEDKLLKDKVESAFPKEKHSKKFVKKMKERVKTFSPSGIAIHPISKHIYILSSQGKTLLEFSPTKQLQTLHFLDKKHAQPEGICFAPNGDLFISNEGKGLGAKIFVYKK